MHMSLSFTRFWRCGWRKSWNPCPIRLVPRSMASKRLVLHRSWVSPQWKKQSRGSRRLPSRMSGTNDKMGGVTSSSLTMSKPAIRSLVNERPDIISWIIDVMWDLPTILSPVNIMRKWNSFGSSEWSLRTFSSTPWIISSSSSRPMTCLSSLNSMPGMCLSSTT